MNRQLREYRAQTLFEKYSGQLANDIHLDVPRRHLDTSVAFLRYLLQDCGASQLTSAFRVTLDRLESEVRRCPPVRLVK